MELILEKISQYKTEIENTVIQNADEAEQFRIKYLGTKGIVKALMGEMKNVPADQKKSFGQVMNEFKAFAENHYADAKTNFHTAEKIIDREDYTLPGRQFPIGSHHPLTIVRNQIVSIFQRLGFSIAKGPEIEDDWHNFGSMNMPENHPARDMQDTFYLSMGNEDEQAWVLRTHTSSVQARIMESQKPPIRIICPGRVFRNETISARAHCFFHQVEGLYIDEQVSFADLKQTLYFFVQEMFGKNVKVRFRPSYFPFTEPSAEMDISCLICGGDGCNICKHTGWVEILGSGMVHPRVLENFKIDSNKYSGFAFGMGIERICQLKYRVNDLRLYSQNDLRFLQQFRGIV